MIPWGGPRDRHGAPATHRPVPCVASPPGGQHRILAVQMPIHQVGWALVSLRPYEYERDDNCSLNWKGIIRERPELKESEKI
jgi:hypothetical protein